MPAPSPGPGYTEDVLVASTTQTANGQTAALPGYGPYGSLRTQVAVTAASGTAPSLVVIIEDSIDGGVTWQAVDTFTAITATGTAVRNVTTPFADRLRVRWTITGTTPSFTFSVVTAAQTPGN